MCKTYCLFNNKSIFAVYKQGFQMGIGVDCSSTKTIQMVCLVFLLYGYQYRFIVRNTVHQVSARRAFSNVNPAFVSANRCFKQVLWDCCHMLVNPTTTIHYCMAINIVSLSEILYTKYPPGGLFLT